MKYQYWLSNIPGVGNRAIARLLGQVGSAREVYEMNREQLENSYGLSEGQIEAGYCVGMNYIQIMWHVVLPQAFRTAFPPLSNSLISMLKDTSLAATITVADMFMAAQRVVGRTYEPLWVYSEVALVYLFMSTLLTILQHYGEKKLGSYTSKDNEIKEVA